MKQGTRLQQRTLKAGVALLCGLGLCASMSPWVAMASTASVSLGVNLLPYGYNAPYTEQVTGTGTHFIQGGSVVYVLQNGSDVHQASNFQVTDGTHLSFSVGSGLQPGQTYTVEVETPVNGQLETETTNLSVASAPSVTGFTDNGQPGASYLGAGYTGVTVSITIANGNLTSQTTVLLQDGSGNGVNTATVSGVQVTGTAGSTQSVGFTLGSGLTAGSYKFILRTNGQDLAVPFTVRNPQVSSVSPASPTQGVGQTLTFTATGARLSSGNDSVKIGSKTYTNVTVTGDNQIAVAIPAADATGTSIAVTLADASESFGTTVSFVAANTPSLSLSIRSVPDGYGTKNVTITPSNFSFGNNPSASLQTSGGTPVPVTLTQSGGAWSFTVPTGLSIGTYTLTVIGLNNAQVTTSFSVTGAAPTTISPSTLTSAVLGQAYSGSAFSADGTGPYTWSVVQGSLPAGMKLSQAGSLSGTPLMTDPTSTPYSFTVQASGTYGTLTKQYTLVLLAPPGITSSTDLGSVTQNNAFDKTLQATGTAPLSWSAVGAIPTGLKLETNGQLHGTVTADAGTYSLTVKASNAAGSDTRKLTLVVNAATPAENGGGGTQGGGAGTSGSQGGSAGSGGSGGSSGSSSGSTTGSTGSTGGSTGSSGWSGGAPGGTGLPAPHWPTRVHGVNHTVLIHRVGDIAAIIRAMANQNLISVSIPKGAFTSQEQVRVSTALLRSVQKIAPKGTVVEGAFGIDFSGKTPSKALTVTIRNREIQKNAVVFRIAANGKLFRLKAKVMKGAVVISIRGTEDLLIVALKG